MDSKNSDTMLVTKNKYWLLIIVLIQSYSDSFRITKYGNIVPIF